MGRGDGPFCVTCIYVRLLCSKGSTKSIPTCATFANVLNLLHTDCVVKFYSDFNSSGFY